MNQEILLRKRPSLSQEVELQLRQSIIAGSYNPGDKLPAERELVEQFQVSRVTVRDALKNLQNMGLLEIKRGIKAGAYVVAPNPLDYAELSKPYPNEAGEFHSPD